MAHLEEIILKAQMTASQSLVEANQQLTHYLDSPFLPFSEKQKIWMQIGENLNKIGKLSHIHEYNKVA